MCFKLISLINTKPRANATNSSVLRLMAKSGGSTVESANSLLTEPAGIRTKSETKYSWLTNKATK